MEFAISRSGTTLVTLHGGSDTTACDDATTELADTLESLAAAGTITDWEIDAADVCTNIRTPRSTRTRSPSSFR